MNRPPRAKAPPPTADEAQATRRKVLESAGEVFSRKGFHDATIREICGLAGANIASVNYHFRDKQGLYVEVLRYANQCAVHLSADRPAPGGARARLRAFIHGYVAAMLDVGRPSWHGRLIAREMMDPSPALDAIVDQNIRPRSQLLSELVTELLGPAATERRVVRCKFSIIGQCLAYHSGRHIHKRLHPGYELREETVDEIADHVAEFSLAAIDAFRAAHRPARRAGRGRGRA